MSELQLQKDIEYIKIHGLQRSGTNYLSHLINENFIKTRTLVNFAGWKHGFYMAPWAMGKEIHVVGIVKNPYAWLVSVYNYWGPNRKLNIGPDLRGVSFNDFVRNRVVLEAQKDIPYLFRACNPVQHWNSMNFHWLSIRMNTKQSAVVTYEALLENPMLILANIGEKLGLKATEKFVDCNQTFTPSGEILRPSGTEFSSKDYYLNAGWKKHYDEDLLEFVNEELDMELMVHFAYNYMTSEDLEG